MKILSVQQLKRMQDEDRDFVLINVLGEDDFERSHIPGSENVPVGRESFEQEVEELAGDRNTPIVVYCADFDCSASPKAAEKLDEAGFEEVYDFEGGLKEWIEAGHDVNRGAGAEL